MLKSLLVFFVAPAIFFGIMAYSYFAGTAIPFLLTMATLIGIPLATSVWLLATSNRRQRQRDQAREEDFLRKQTEASNEGE